MGTDISENPRVDLGKPALTANLSTGYGDVRLACWVKYFIKMSKERSKTETAYCLQNTDITFASSCFPNLFL